jgi:hypothetical protein
MGDVLTLLNCYKLLVGNSYKVLQGKYKMIPVLRNVCSWLMDKHFSE